MKNPKHIVVFTSKEDSPEFPKSSKIEWSNPYFYAQPRDKADAVYAPNNPKIEEAYTKAGKVAWRPSEAVVEAPKETPKHPDNQPDTSPTKTDEETSNGEAFEQEESGQEAGQEEEKVEGHWSELSWPKLRSLATEFTDDPVKSKDQAKEILEKAESEGKL